MTKDRGEFSQGALQKQLTRLFIVCWALLAFFFLSGSLRTSFKVYPLLWGRTLQGKKELLEGDLYTVAKQCEEHIPEGEPLFFYNRSRPPKAYPGHSAHFAREHDRQKLSYFLYPRRVYWEPEKVREPIRYALIYHDKVEMKGFEHLLDLAEDVYLLKREEKK